MARSYFVRRSISSARASGSVTRRHGALDDDNGGARWFGPNRRSDDPQNRGSVRVFAGFRERFASGSNRAPW